MTWQTLVMKKTEIFVTDNNFDETIVSFSDITSKPQFRGLSSKYNLIQVVDHTKSWYTNLDVDRIKKYLDGKPVITIGLSMGGYNAIQFNKDYPVSLCVAFSPQYSIHPSFGETRWTEHADKIAWNYNNTKLTLSGVNAYVAFDHKHKDELIHFSEFHKASRHNPCIKVKNYPGYGHNIPDTIKKSENLMEHIFGIINEYNK